MSKDYVIIGGGITGLTAVKEIRRLEPDARIALIGDEGYYPYNRIRLSKSLLNTLEEDKILLQKKPWYDENNVTLYLSDGVTSIDTSNRVVRLIGGTELRYDSLLLANGASNAMPPIQGIDLEGVYTLRTLDETLAINKGLHKYNHILNIGGGIQGLELAWIFKQMGKDTTIVEMADRLMPRQLDDISSSILKAAVESQGVEVLLDCRVSELYGDESVKGARLSNGADIPCDMINVAVGIKPNIDIAKDAGIRCSSGILVDNKMRTNIEDIYAAGDIVEYNGEVLGLWNIAIGHGKVAGSNMTGNSAIYNNITPVTTLNAFGINLFSMGEVDEDRATNIIVDGSLEEGYYNKVLIKDNKVIGGIVVGNIRLSPLLKGAIEKVIDLEGVDYNSISFEELLDTIRERK